MTEADRTVLFLVDAMRFEMATELIEMLGSDARLRPRLAELPSVTEIGMNALAPIAQSGKLRPLLADGKGKPAQPDDRRKAMATRAGGVACSAYPIEDVVRMSAADLRLGAASIQAGVVISTQIDGAGEKGLGPSAFAGELQRIHAAWHRLREAGVNNFVITSDHGFLLREKNDFPDSTEAKPAVAKSTESKLEPPPAAPAGSSWLDVYEDPKVRRVFAHIEQFGSINAQEATAMLGSPRAFRSFAGKFEQLAGPAPFAITIEVVGATKRYVKRS